MENQTPQDRIERLEAAVEDIANAVTRIDRRVEDTGKVVGYLFGRAKALDEKTAADEAEAERAKAFIGTMITEPLA